jgi:hypothetical protein
VTPTLHRQRKAVCAGEADSLDDVLDARTADDQRRVAVDHGVEHASSGVVSAGPRGQGSSLQPRGELPDQRVGRGFQPLERALV